MTPGHTDIATRLDALFAQLAARVRHSAGTGRRPALRPVLRKLVALLEETGDPALEAFTTAIRAAAGREGAPHDVEELASLCDAWAAMHAPPLEAVAVFGRGAGSARRGDSSPAVDMDDEIVTLFIGEALDHLGSIEASVLQLEARPGDPQALDEVFRPFHTIKGNAAALGFHEIEDLAHAVEDLLDRARSGELHLGAPEIEVVLAAVDLLTVLVRDLEGRRSGAPGGQFEERTTTLRAAIDRVLSDAPEAVLPVLPIETMPSIADVQSAPGLTLLAPAETTAQPTIKVDTRKLDNLIDLVGELVIVQSMIHQHPHLLNADDERLNRSMAQLHRITSDLHRSAIALRLVPIRQTFNRMRRLVRDVSRKAGKPVELTVTGEEIELDRKVVEEIADPLMHMLRNSIDHGVEDFATRRAAGKPAAGQLTLSASYEGGNVLVAVSDDGRGLDTDKLYQRAVARGLVDASSRPTDAELHNLVFHPGFSTATEVTELSGRGVGMDVVRRNVESLRGRIEIRSRTGHGTTFLIKLPLTLATIEGLLVAVGSERFVLPTYAVHESLRPSIERLHTVPGKGSLVEVREDLMPIVRLSDLFGISHAITDPTEAALVVLEDAGRRMALMVDQLVGKQDVVIKSLGEAFANVEGVAGGAILADGRIGLILDAAGLIRLRELGFSRAA